jgi:hypothetical protein
MNPTADETSFDPAAVAQISWNATQSKAAAESTVARVVTDGKYLYVRFDASQNERIVSAQPVNAKSNSDLVWLDVWSKSGAYRFASAPDGSSSAIAPDGSAVSGWQASGTSFPGGYTVTMKIPLSTFRAAGDTGAINVQFARSIAGSGQQLVWSHEGSGSADDVAQAGTMTLAGAK